MNDHPLADSYLKVERAKELLVGIAEETHQIGNQNPMTVEVGGNKKTGAHFIRLLDLPAWPPKWAVMVGEIVHNLRSALDYVVFQLAGGAEEKRTAFPIAEKEGPYFRPRGSGPSYRDQCLDGVDSVWAEKIDGLQPFRNPGSRLAVLNWLSNRDKHRIRHDCFSVIRTPLGTVVADASEAGRDLEMRSIPGQEVLIRSQVRGPQRKGHRLIGGVSPEKRGPIDLKVAFGNRCVSVGNLAVVIEEVETILDGFKPAFDPSSPAD